MNDMFNISNPNIRASYSLGVFKVSYSKYKNLLNNTQLEIYNFLISNYEKPNGDSHTLTFKNKPDKKTINFDLEVATRAFYLDNPMMYWAEKFDTEIASANGIVQSVKFTLTSEYYNDYALESTKMSKITNKANSIISAMNRERFTTDLDKFTYLHDTLMNNTTYDTPAATDKNNYPNSHDPYGALVLGKSVCEGNTLALSLLCHKANIPCITVMGRKGSSAHAWNYVKLNDKWTFVDPTNSNTASSKYKYRYFLRQIPSSYAEGTGLPVPTVKDSYFIKYGDVDQDGVYTFNDASLARQKITANSFKGADKVIIDVDGSGTCDDGDVLPIQNKVLNGDLEFYIYQKLNNYK